MSVRSPYACPSCKRQMFSEWGKKLALHACGACRGIWLDHEDAERVIHGYITEEDRAKAQLVDGGPAETALGYRSAASVLDAAARQCPHCGKELERRGRSVLGRRIEIDVCGHGVWFDRGELLQLADESSIASTGDMTASQRMFQSSAVMMGLELELDRLLHVDPTELPDRVRRMRAMIAMLRESMLAKR